MRATELLSKLRGLKVRVRADNGRLFCDGPRDVLTAELRAALNEHKAEILALLDRPDTAARRREAPLRSTPREGDLPLSFAQQRLWFIDQLEPGSALYNVPKAFRIRGALNTALLERSLNEIVRRHEVLRASFSPVDGLPLQNISPSLTIPLSVVDLADRPDGEQTEEALRLINEEAGRPFDLTCGPLLRSFLVRLAAEDHILLLTVHHIVSDGWSMEILYRELSVLYDAFRNGRSSPLGELPIQYIDFARWQREWLQGEVLQSQIHYWKERLANIPILQLPTDRPRPAVQSHHGARLSMLLADELCEALKGFSQKQRSSLFMTLLAAFNVLLYRYSGQEDVVVGTPIAGRNHAEIEPLIGFFVNTLVLRTDLSGDCTFRELLARVRDVALDAYTYQDLPFEKLVEELDPERTLGHVPLSQVMFAFQNFPASPLEISGCSAEPLDVDARMARFDLTLQISQETSGMRCLLTYDADLFDQGTMARTLGHFRTLLERIVADPDKGVSELGILTEAERHQLLVEWNNTRKEYPREKCAHQLFEEQADRTPEAVAVEFEYQQLTYRDLNRRANQLAHYLKNFGVGQEVLVGICMERSLEMIVGLLGILKAGGAYVPLDPAYPKDRLGFMLEDAKVPVLLAQQSLLDSLQLSALSPQPLLKILCPDTELETIGRESEDNPINTATVENLAYVIYTSGSTGKPRGVQIPHRALANFLNSMRREPGLTSQDTLLSVTTLSFDICALELFLPLVAGARTVILSREIAADGLLLSKALSRDVATAMQATPATWRMLIEAGWQGSDILKILCGGEVLPRELAARLLARCSSVWNVYGPTETTIWSSLYRVANSDGATPIGRPIANTQIYILDAHLQAIPIGTAGELYIGGEDLARGYLNCPELTAEKFIPNPFSQEPGARMYRTGDKARHLPDGAIEFLGRIDHQVKIRGFRIELGEVEAVLARHPAVEQVVVTAMEDEQKDPSAQLWAGKRLVVYVVPKGKSNAAELRGYLKQKLPDHMIPSAYVMLDTLPLTPNGKVDRRALPVAELTRSEQENPFVSPSTAEEGTIAEIWTQILNVDQVGIHDNFFDLGGHSLLATRVVSRLREAFQMEIPLRALFENPTVAGLAAQIAKTQAKAAVVSNEIADVLDDLESLSEEEAKRLLAQEILTKS